VSTIRRLNRVEYRNTIRDLMGHDFKVEDELPPDDTGYGFDNIGDGAHDLADAPGEYMQAAETIVAAAVPRVGRVVAEKNDCRKRLAQFGRQTERRPRFSFYDEAKLSRKLSGKNHRGQLQAGTGVRGAWPV